MTGIARHLRGNIVGYVALFFALSAGAYAAGLGPDSVGSREIKNGQVRTQDVADDAKPGALTGENVAPDSLDGFDIQGLSFADVQSDTLTGAQIDEGTLAQGGAGSSNVDACNPSTASFLNCVSTTVNLAHPGRLLLIGSAQYWEEGDDGYEGTCRLRDTQGAVMDPRYFFSGGTPSRYEIPFVAVTNVLPAGLQAARLECNEENFGSITYPHASLAAVALSSR